ncbi:hypothetical protein WN55_10638 [Dufourea novaeangliae]|uniref:Uncharacterized protein n=1 Tax=Dufourea novaeangliae TaxID=178035 RepID=A0A154P5V1_DUFNO|nr:hypothetical protein WN55_10638 [Dufourea novaeangliae]
MTVFPGPGDLACPVCISKDLTQTRLECVTRRKLDKFYGKYLASTDDPATRQGFREE